MIASAAQSCDVDICGSSAGLSCPSMRISVCPQGDFEMIKRACGGAGDYIWVEVIGICGGGPIPGIPLTDFWFDACDPAQELSLCTGGIVADSLTGANGRTTFSGLVRGGGCVLSGGIWIAVQGQRILDYPCATQRCLPIVVKSPDLTGAGGIPDRVINLSDLVPFGFSYNKYQSQHGYNACCDYNDDSKCNLSDFAYFGTHYQHRCM
jgi:hypothetical protein